MFLEEILFKKVDPKSAFGGKAAPPGCVALRASLTGNLFTVDENGRLLPDPEHYRPHEEPQATSSSSSSSG